MSITLEMDGNYPDISSGIVSFENARTGTKLTIELPKDLLSGIYGIRSITMELARGQEGKTAIVSLPFCPLSPLPSSKE